MFASAPSQIACRIRFLALLTIIVAACSFARAAEPSRFEAGKHNTAELRFVEGLPVVVVHGHQLGTPTPEKLVAAYPEALTIIYGHTHRPLLTVVDQVVTVMNPGGAGRRRFDLPPSVGILEFEAGIPPRGRLVPLLAAGED